MCPALCAFAAEPSKLRIPRVTQAPKLEEFLDRASPATGVRVSGQLLRSYTREEGGGRLAGPAYYARLDHQGRHLRYFSRYLDFSAALVRRGWLRAGSSSSS